MEISISPQSPNGATRLSRIQPKRLSGVGHQFIKFSAVSATMIVGAILTVAHPAEARIVYTPVNVQIASGTYNLDVNNDGKTDFQTIGSWQYSCGYFFGSLRIFSATANGVASDTVGALALTAGSTIDQTLSYSSSALMLRTDVSGPPPCFLVAYGYWVSRPFKPLTAYLGVRFKVNGKAHYGWARATIYISVGNGSVQATLTGYAYETRPNKPITAGQT